MKGTLKLRTASLAAAAVMAAGLFAALPAAAETSTPETAQEDSGVPYDVANGLENSFRYKDGVPIYDDSVPAIEWEDIVQQDAATYSSNGIATCSVTYNGFDVSFHQGTVDWDAVKNSGIDFVMIRCGIGSEYDGVGENKQDDAQWYRNVSECERLGIPYGVYLYSYAENTDMAASEARHTLSLLSGHNPTLPVFLDIEHTRNGNPIASNSTYGDIAQTWCNMVSNAGYRVGIYSYYYFFQNYLTDSRFSNSGWYKWMADYRSGVSYDGSSCNMWQYSNKGTVPGVDANVDLNYWFGEYPGNNNYYTGWRSENGRDYWYENGVKQGTTGRGKEIYDSGSNAWYWLDANQGGAKAVNKDVYQESNGGKWVRYDANGHMVKGEDCQNGKWYYFEPVTGAMIKGPWTLPKYLPPKPTIALYLDSPQENMITCDVAAIYGEKKYHVYGKERYSQKRNFTEEHRLAEIIQMYFNAFDQEKSLLVYSGDEGDIFTFLSQVIPKLQKYGDIYVTDSMKKLRVVPSASFQVGVSVSGGLLEMSMASNQFNNGPGRCQTDPPPR